MGEPKTRVGETFPNFNLGPLEAGPYKKPGNQTPCGLIARWREAASRERASSCRLPEVSENRALVFEYCADQLEMLYKLR
jgi:hypothetical protein